MMVPSHGGTIRLGCGQGCTTHLPQTVARDLFAATP